MEESAPDPGVSARRGTESGQKRSVGLWEGVVLSAAFWLFVAPNLLRQQLLMCDSSQGAIRTRFSSY